MGNVLLYYQRTGEKEHCGRETPFKVMLYSPLSAFRIQTLLRVHMVCYLVYSISILIYVEDIVRLSGLRQNKTEADGWMLFGTHKENPHHQQANLFVNTQ